MEQSRKPSKYCRPPSRFNPAGEVIWAQFAPEPPSFKSNEKMKGKRHEGMLYEVKAQEYIQETVEEEKISNKELSYLRSPWITFKSNGDTQNQLRFCQPDGVLIDLAKKHITMIEIKLQHTSDAWWQLRELYEPVLRHIYQGFTFSAVEVVRWLDPHVAFPEIFHFAPSVLGVRKNSFGVHIFYQKKRAKKCTTPE